MRHALRFLVTASIVVLGSCAHPVATAPPLPKPPPKATAVAPEVSKIREVIADADKQATAVRNAAKEAAGAATGAREEAGRLAEKRSATPAELDALWKSVQVVEARNLFLESKAASLSADLSDARGASAKLEEIAAAKDAEALQLRSQFETLSATATHYADALKAADREAESQRTRADKLAGEIRLYRLALGIAVLLLVIWILIKLFLPPRLLA